MPMGHAPVLSGVVPPVVDVGTGALGRPCTLMGVPWSELSRDDSFSDVNFGKSVASIGGWPRDVIGTAGTGALRQEALRSLDFF